MKSFPCLMLGLALLSGTPLLHADDWKTTDGKVYQNVTVVKTAPDAVTILHHNGGALVPLAKLPPDLQKRFNFDPVLAKLAADRRAEVDAENARALQAEIERTEQKQQAALIAQHPNGSEVVLSGGSTEISTSRLSAPFDSKHYTTGQLIDTSVKLRWDHDYGDAHYSMGALFSSNQHLSPDPDANHHTVGDLFP